MSNNNAIMHLEENERVVIGNIHNFYFKNILMKNFKLLFIDNQSRLLYI